MFKLNSGKRKLSKGYSLIEIAGVMVVMGLLMSAAMAAYRVYFEKTRNTTTVENVSYVVERMTSYLTQKGAYPLPAALNDPRTSANYGMQRIRADIAAITADGCNAAQGVCIEETNRPLASNAMPAMADCNEGNTNCDFAGYTATVEYVSTTDSSKKIVMTGVVDTINCNNSTFINATYADGDPHNGTAKVCKMVSGTKTVPDPVVTSRIIRGFIPFRELNLPEEMAYDGYNNRLQYVVTEDMTNTLTKFDSKKGAISIVDTNGDSVISPAGSGHFIVFSTGQNAIGAYSKEGALVHPCSAGTGYDTENCNTSATGANSFGVYRVANFSTSGGATAYDDILKHYTSGDIPLWVVDADNVNNIVDNISAASSTANHVAIGAVPTPKAMLYVAGNVQAVSDPMVVGDAYSGSLRTQAVCSASSVGDPNCDYGVTTLNPLPADKDNLDTTRPEMLQPARIGGYYDDSAADKGATHPKFSGLNKEMNCPTGYYAYGIENGKVKCEEDANAGTYCPDGEYIVSIKTDTSGNRVVQCAASETAPDCAAATWEICSPESAPYNTQSVSVPTGRTGDSHVVRPFDFTPSIPNDFVAFYGLTCRNGAWEQDGTGSRLGLCRECVPGTVVTNLACTSVDDGNQDAGYWDGGTYPYTEVTNGCTTYMTYTTTAPYQSVCNCTTSATDYAPRTVTNPDCAWNQTGTVTYVSNWTCSGAHSGSWSAWSQQSNTCAPDPACTDVNESRYLYDCPAYYSGRGNRETRTRQCSSGLWSSWTASGDAAECSCPVTNIKKWDYVCTGGKSGKGKEFNGTQDCMGTVIMGSATGAEDCTFHRWKRTSSPTGGPYGVAPTGVPVENSTCDIINDGPRSCYVGGYTYDCSCQ